VILATSRFLSFDLPARRASQKNRSVAHTSPGAKLPPKAFFNLRFSVMLRRA